MLFAVPVLLRKHPLHPLSTTRETLQRFAVLIPYQTFVIRIPVQLQMFFVYQTGRHG